jgi:hypothetical protein
MRLMYIHGLVKVQNGSVQMSEGLNNLYPKSEWLWSHPAEGGESTPVPCLIQQDALQLNTLREKIGYDKQD